MPENALNKNNLFQTTNELYRLTLLFPKKEPLRYKMRELSNDVLATFVSLDGGDSYEDKIVKTSVKRLEILDGFFDLAKNQNWVKPSDMLDLQIEYGKIKRNLMDIRKKNGDKGNPLPTRKELNQTNQFTKLVKPAKKPAEISDRQKKILGLLKEKEKAQVWEIKQALPEVSKRTLRRDFRDLLEYGLVERLGEKNNTFYQVRGRTQAL